MKKFIKKTLVTIMTVAMVFSSVGTIGTKVEAAPSSYVLQNHTVQDLMKEYGVIAFNDSSIRVHFHSNFLVKNLRMDANAGLRTTYNIKENFYFESADRLNSNMSDYSGADTDVLYTSTDVVKSNGENKVRLKNGSLFKIDRPTTVIGDAEIRAEGTYSQYVDMTDVKNKFITYNKAIAEQENKGDVQTSITSDQNNRYIKVGAGENYCNISYTDFAKFPYNEISFDFSNYNNDDTLVINIDLKNQTNVSLPALILRQNGSSISNNEDNFTKKYNRVYFNFYDSSKVDKQYTGEITFNGRGFGTIIAPSASVNVPHNWDGSIVANDLDLGGQFHRINGTSVPYVTTSSNDSDVNTNIPENETPKNDEPEKDTPVDETPKNDEPEKDTPVDETPKNDEPEIDTPVDETPKNDEPKKDTPVDETPKNDEPKKDTPVDETPKNDEPEKNTPVNETPKNDEPEKDTPVDETPKNETPEMNNTESNNSQNTGDLSITIKDETTDDPVPGATVEVTSSDGEKTEYVTDENGKIEIEKVPEGDYTVEVTDVPDGYDVTTSNEVNVTVKKDKKTKKTVSEKKTDKQTKQDAKNANKVLRNAADIKTGEEVSDQTIVAQKTDITQLSAKNDKTITKKYYKQLKSYKKKHKKQSKEIAAWISIAGTKINYPVMYSGIKNNTKYLQKNINGKKDSHGMLFASYMTPKRKITYNNVIYGHNMKDGTMFTDLTKYASKSFYKNHKYVKIYTQGYNYAYEVVEVIRISCKKGSKDRMIYEKFAQINNKKTFKKWQKQVAKNREYKCSGKYKNSDKLLMLSTCEYEKENGRFIVICKQVKCAKVK